jgi:CheY-like chemotaxis protein
VGVLPGAPSGDDTWTGASVVRVLVADGDPIFTLMLTRCFERKGWDVIIAADAARTLDHAGRRPRPDVIVLDLGLPGGEGTLLLQILKKAPSTASIPVVAVSGSLAGPIEELALARGAALFTRKPVDPPSLIVLIESLGVGAERRHAG